MDEAFIKSLLDMDFLCQDVHTDYVRDFQLSKEPGLDLFRDHDCFETFCSTYCSDSDGHTKDGLSCQDFENISPNTFQIIGEADVTSLHRDVSPDSSTRLLTGQSQLMKEYYDIENAPRKFIGEPQNEDTLKKTGVQEDPESWWQLFGCFDDLDALTSSMNNFDSTIDLIEPTFEVLDPATVEEYSHIFTQSDVDDAIVDSSSSFSPASRAHLEFCGFNDVDLFTLLLSSSCQNDSTPNILDGLDDLWENRCIDFGDLLEPDSAFIERSAHITASDLLLTPHDCVLTPSDPLLTLTQSDLLLTSSDLSLKTSDPLLTTPSDLLITPSDPLLTARTPSDPLITRSDPLLTILTPSNPFLTTLTPSDPLITPSDPLLTTLTPSGPLPTKLTPSDPLITPSDPLLTTLTPSDPSITPSDPLLTTLTPSDPLLTTLTPSNPLLTTLTPSDPLLTTLTPSNPLLTTLTPSDPLLTTLTPSDPLLATLTPSDPLITPYVPLITPSDPLLTSLTPSDPLFTTLTPSDPLITPSDPLLTTLTPSVPLLSLPPYDPLLKSPDPLLMSSGPFLIPSDPLQISVQSRHDNDNSNIFNHKFENVLDANRNNIMMGQGKVPALPTKSIVNFCRPTNTISDRKMMTTIQTQRHKPHPYVTQIPEGDMIIRNVTESCSMNSSNCAPFQYITTMSQPVKRARDFYDGAGMESNNRVSKDPALLMPEISQYPTAVVGMTGTEMKRKLIQPSKHVNSSLYFNLNDRSHTVSICNTALNKGKRHHDSREIIARPMNESVEINQSHIYNETLNGKVLCGSVNEHPVENKSPVIFRKSNIMSKPVNTPDNSPKSYPDSPQYPAEKLDKCQCPRIKIGMENNFVSVRIRDILSKNVRDVIGCFKEPEHKNVNQVTKEWKETYRILRERKIKRLNSEKNRLAAQSNS